MHFYAGRSFLTGGFRAEMTFGAQPLENTDYTLFVVARFPETVRLRIRNDDGEVVDVGIDRNPTGSFLHGTSKQRGNNLVLGRIRGGLVRMYHMDPVAADASYPTDGDFHVYAFRFSRTVGMQVTMDGESKVSRPDNTVPLTGFVGARLAAAWFDEQIAPGTLLSTRASAVSIAELTACEIAGTPEQTEQETLNLRQKYGI